MECAVCGGRSRPLFTHDTYDFYECEANGCAHVFVSPVPTEEELAKVYESEEAGIANSDGWNLARDYETSPQTVQRHMEKARIGWLRKNGLLQNKDLRLLDVGCSTGIFLRVLKDKGYANVSGLDLAENHCAYIRDTHHLPCVQRWDDLPDGSFDLITCFAVLEHAPAPLEFLRQAKQKLAPGGRIVILVPNYRSFYRRMAGRSWIWLIPPIHLQYFGPRSLGRAGAEAELRTVRMESLYMDTYTYLAVYHLMKILNRKMPDTARTGRDRTMLLVHTVEALLRIVLFPASLIARWTGRHNELMCVFAEL